MTFFYNLIQNDYMFYPLYVGWVGMIGWSWWSESVGVFNQVTHSPSVSWPWNPSTIITTPQSYSFNQGELLRFQREAEFETRLATLERIQENTKTIIDKLDELKAV